MSDLAHKKEYDAIRADYPHIPAWEDLDEVQKAGVRAANEGKWRFFTKLGSAIRDGGELPDPMTDMFDELRKDGAAGEI